ncbi:MAG: hypothetical protein ACC707_05295 [Thiohalomonadales bacterium]
MKNSDRYQIDKLILENGEYTPLEYLLQEGRLNYGDYDSWRNGNIELLSDLLFGNLEHILSLLENAEGYLQQLGWQVETLEYQPIRGNGARRLIFSHNSKLEFLFHKRFSKSSEQPQSDMFMDSPATILSNKVAQALRRQDRQEARDYLEKLFDSAPEHTRLAELEILVEALESLDSPIDNPAQQIQVLHTKITPAAKNILRKDSRELLTPLWRCLSKTLAQHSFQHDLPELHTSYCATLSQDWQTVRQCIEAESQWLDSAVLLSRHAIACDRLRQPGLALLSWFELCWRFPQQSELLEQNATDDLQRSWTQFLELEPELPENDFPAWLLLKKPGLLKILPKIEEPERTELRDYHILCRLSTQNTNTVNSDDLISLRAQLKQTNPDLFRHYIAAVV